MKIKSNILMIGLLSSLLLLTGLGITLTKDNVAVIEEPEEIIDVTAPSTYIGTITNSGNVPSEVLKTITDYLDSYFLSLFDLQTVDNSELFSSDVYHLLSSKAIDLIINTRKLYDFNFRLTKAHYDLDVVNYESKDGKYYVTVNEDDFMNFAFLNGIQSEIYDIRCEFVLDSDYKISYFYKEQGHFIMFADEDEKITSEMINSRYDKYIDTLYKQYVYNNEVLKPKALNNNYISKKTYSKSYNRSAAVSYIDKYYHNRNTDWYDFDGEGGNCQNFASQAIYEGGIPMDYLGEDQWKCYINDPLYDPDINVDEIASGRTRSWVNVGYFYNYCDYNEGSGLVADCNANIYYAEPGDVVLVGNNGLSHTTMVSKVIDGHILVNGNSIDMKDYPIEAYTYTNICLIKILGSN